METVILTRDIVDHLPRFNRAVALLMAEEGRIEIIDDDGGE